jgi:hypothetical protein
MSFVDSRSAEPGATIIAQLQDRIIISLIVKPQILPITPLSSSKLNARLEISNDLVDGSPAASVLCYDNLVLQVAPVHMQLGVPITCAIADGADRDTSWGFPEVQFT